ncbi:MAG: hypothetical protein WHS44_11470 [Fimbriimonadales bacterium]|nr:MAG: hypothetical protein KatS3mg018_0069 [Fimbriimonadales bacterium]
MREISDAQRLVLDLMRHGNFNQFDGDAVADDLMQHSDLWIACWFGDHSMPLRSLANLSLYGSIHGDSLYVLTTEENWESLVSLAESWEYDEIYAVFQNSDTVLLIAGDETYTTDPETKQELENSMGYALETLSEDLNIPALVLLQIWWD